MKMVTCFLILAMIFIAGNVQAIDYPKPTSWVNDYAGVVSREQKQELDSLLKEFETKTTNQIFVCIMQNLPAETSLEEYVNELFERWKPGQKGEDNGALLAIFINDRKLRIEVGYGLEEKLTDAASKLIIANDITPAFKQGNYYAGIRKGIESMILAIQPGYTLPSRKIPASRPQQRPSRRSAPADIPFETIFWFIVIAVIIIVKLMKIGKSGWSGGRSGWRKHRRRSSWSISFGSGSSGWSSGSSSWSSGGSSSGFSGGGGGSSGGGGASGSW